MLKFNRRLVWVGSSGALWPPQLVTTSDTTCNSPITIFGGKVTGTPELLVISTGTLQVDLPGAKQTSDSVTATSGGNLETLVLSTMALHLNPGVV